MKRFQKLVVVLALLAVVVTGFYPPWLRIDRRGIERPSEYAFLFTSPGKSTDAFLANGPVVYRVDFLRLVEGWGCVVGLAGLCMVPLRKRVPAGRPIGAQRTRAMSGLLTPEEQRAPHKG